MGLLSKLKGEPSRAELDREAKKKVEADRARMEDLRARLEASAAISSGHFDEEDALRVRAYLKNASESMKNVMPASFDVTGIDRKISGLIQVLERSLQENGSPETALHCLQGIAYGVIRGHASISENAVESDMIRRREDMADRYLRIAQQSLELDQMEKDVTRKAEQKEQRELELEQTEKELQSLIDEHPSAYYALQEMTPKEMDEVTGPMKEMAGKMQKAVNLQKGIRQLELLIAQRKQDINTVEASNNTLYTHLTSWESEIDEQSIADIIRLGQEFEKDLLASQAKMKSLAEATDELDKAVNYILAGKNEKEKQIETVVMYEKLKKTLLRQDAEDEAGRQRYAQEQEALRQETEKQAQERMRTENDGHREISYN